MAPVQTSLVFTGSYILEYCS